MEMCYNGALVMPSSYAVVGSDEMEYLGGGFSVSKAAFKYTVTAVVVAGCIALGGWLSVAGLKTVLGSMALKSTLIKCIVKGVGMLGIGCAIISKIISRRKVKEKAMYLEKDDPQNDPVSNSNELTPPDGATDNIT